MIVCRNSHSSVSDDEWDYLCVMFAQGRNDVSVHGLWSLTGRQDFTNDSVAG